LAEPGSNQRPPVLKWRLAANVTFILRKK
jgi:hypothetical protein